MHRRAAALSVLMALAMQACVPAAPAVTPTIESTPTPAATRTPRPTSTPAGPADCLQWEDVNGNQDGEEVCVFGDVLFGFSVEDGNGDIVYWVLRFAEDPATFYLVQNTLPFEFESGDCISVTGQFEVDDNGTPFIENGEMRRC